MQQNDKPVRRRGNLGTLLLKLMGYGGAATGAAYVASPIDLIPDVFLGIGQMDDAVVIVLALLFLSAMLVLSGAMEGQS